MKSYENVWNDRLDNEMAKDRGGKLGFYRKIKMNFQYEEYLDTLKNGQHRKPYPNLEQVVTGYGLRRAGIRPRKLIVKIEFVLNVMRWDIVTWMMKCIFSWTVNFLAMTRNYFWM